MNEAIKKLYKFNKKSLQAINKTFGIDFNKPLEAITIEGNTTINQILKKVDHDALIIVLTNTPGYYGQECCRKHDMPMEDENNDHCEDFTV